MDWKVSLEVAEVLPHYNADSLDIIRLGESQLVARKGTYQSGDTLIFIPAKSVLPDGPLRDSFIDYLRGAARDRVGEVRLRGEPSCGVTWPLKDIGLLGLNREDAARIAHAEIGEDIADALGITRYEPPIPAHMGGVLRRIEGADHFRHHDCHPLGSNLRHFVEGETVTVTEKLHGTQITAYWNGTELMVSSKGRAKLGVHIEEDGDSLYWRAVRNSDLHERIVEAIRELGGDPHTDHLQVIGEVIPAQKGYSYGQTVPTVFIFDVMFRGNVLPLSTVPASLYTLWVPILAQNLPVDPAQLRKFAKGKETVSGKGVHIREGVVVRPTDVTRRTPSGDRLHLKIINDAYKETGDEFN
ncbi:RNA ligase (ATP) [Deinococcus sp. 6YEL10]|uniref:RNA ligase (ATP) n=1 Tax=Deinococcus sp. 6YEL10 TaxID=2745870 RepID=UPI001E5CCA23|nr:RNA ligase (ATP) [Deinococcus sp. 6YEL10]MCD0159744.1 RNA ligase (ATP) [Deinococcus sp. 6YEL10]